jgi:predicted phosphodiesterase
MKIRIIGDVHGCINNCARLPEKPSYIKICQDLSDVDYSIQLGDMGFDYSELPKFLCPSQHMFFSGNHDNFDQYYKCKHALGDFGYMMLQSSYEESADFFFVRGSYSIDKKYRLDLEKNLGVKSWWEEEELTDDKMKQCFNNYQMIKPKVVLSHDCPSIVSSMIGNPDILTAFGLNPNFVARTQSFLQKLFNIHQPKLWLFGHYHKNWEVELKGTHFMCVGERDYIDFDPYWNVL